MAIELISEIVSSNCKVSTSLDKMEMVLKDESYLHGELGQHHIVSLNGVSGLCLINEFPDYEKQAQEQSKKNKGDKTNRLILGALVGVVVDGLSEADSVLDGAVIGATIGYATTPVKKLDIKEQSMHYVNLLFIDGNSLSLSVDSKGLSQLISITHKATTNESYENFNFISVTPYNDEEISLADKNAVTRFKTEGEEKASALVVIINSILSLILLWLVIVNLPLPIPGYYSGDWSEMNWFIPLALLGLIVGFSYREIVRSKTNKKVEVLNVSAKYFSEKDST